MNTRAKEGLFNLYGYAVHATLFASPIAALSRNVGISAYPTAFTMRGFHLWWLLVCYNATDLLSVRKVERLADHCSSPGVNHY